MNDGTTGVNPSATLERETDLYRFYDAGGRLLYVGISLSAVKRAAEHRGDKDWWPEVSRMEVKRHPTRAAALDAERAAIATEGPAYNVTHNGNNGGAAASASPATPPPASDSLVGWFFLTPDPEHGWPLGNRQGHVAAKVGDNYMVQLYSWFDGAPTNAEMCSPGEMVGWRFFASEEAWRDGGTEVMRARDRSLDQRWPVTKRSR